MEDVLLLATMLSLEALNASLKRSIKAFCKRFWANFLQNGRGILIGMDSEKCNRQRRSSGRHLHRPKMPGLLSRAEKGKWVQQRYKIHHPKQPNSEFELDKRRREQENTDGKGVLVHTSYKIGAKRRRLVGFCAEKQKSRRTRKENEDEKQDLVGSVQRCKTVEDDDDDEK